MNLDDLYVLVQNNQTQDLTSAQWVQLLQVYPYLVNVCDCLADFNSSQIFQILVNNGALVDYMDCAKLTQIQWDIITRYQPQIKNHPLYKISML